MAYFDWETKYDVGVPPMNEQHQRLIALMNRLHDRCDAGAERTEVAQVVDELACYTVEHFAAEERYMASVNYPRLETHKLIHQELLAVLAKHRQVFGRTGTLGVEFFSFLKFWLASHIQGIDKQYGAHARVRAA